MPARRRCELRHKAPQRADFPIRTVSITVS
jgi:hypothetical protein